jgi:hypothetical protein
LAATNSIADALGHAATHAPHPMHAAASIARSASRFGTSTAFASGALPARAVMNPPACMIRSKAPRSTTRSFSTGNALARHGSIQISSPSRNARMWSWQAVVARCGPCGRPLITMPHEPQIPSRQSWSKATGSPRAPALVQRVEQLEKGESVDAAPGANRPAPGPGCR